MPRNREEADLFFCSVTPLQNVRNENLGTQDNSRSWSRRRAGIRDLPDQYRPGRCFPIPPWGSSISRSRRLRDRAAPAMTPREPACPAPPLSRQAGHHRPDRDAGPNYHEHCFRSIAERTSSTGSGMCSISRTMNVQYYHNGPLVPKQENRGSRYASWWPRPRWH